MGFNGIQWDSEWQVRIQWDSSRALIGFPHGTMVNTFPANVHLKQHVLKLQGTATSSNWYFATRWSITTYGHFFWLEMWFDLIWRSRIMRKMVIQPRAMLGVLSFSPQTWVSDQRNCDLSNRICDWTSRNDETTEKWDPTRKKAGMPHLWRTNNSEHDNKDCSFWYLLFLDNHGWRMNLAGVTYERLPSSPSFENKFGED